MIPKQACGEVEMVSVEWLLKNLQGSADDYQDTDEGEVLWPELLDGKVWDSSFPDLVHTIETKGFRVPVCLYPNQTHGGWSLGNGHHRMSAAILMCLDEIPVFWSDYDYMSTTYTSPDYETLETQPDGGFLDLLGEVWVFGEMKRYQCCKDCG